MNCDFNNITIDLWVIGTFFYVFYGIFSIFKHISLYIFFILRILAYLKNMLRGWEWG